MLTVKKNRIIKADKAITNFLVNIGALPAYKDKADATLKIQEELQSKFQKLFNEAGDKFITEFTKQSQMTEDAIREAIATNLADMPSIQSQSALDGATAGREIVTSILQQTGRTIEFTAFAPPVQERIVENFTQYARDTMGRMADDIADTIVSGYNEGLGTNDIARNLRNQFDDFTYNRSRTIARTEITTAENQGKQETYDEFNVEYIQWITAQDDRVRNSPEDEYDHVALHGQVIRRGESFIHPTQGWSMRYPGDRSAPLGAYINDRCTTRPYIPREGEIISVTPYYP